MAKNLILWVVIALVLMSVFNNFGPRRAGAQQIDYSQFIADVKQGRVQKVVIEGRNIQGVLQTGERFGTYTPETDNRALIGDLLENGVVIDARPPEQQSLLMQIFISWFPMLLLIGVWICTSCARCRVARRGRGALLVRQEPRASLLDEDQVNSVTFRRRRRLSTRPRKRFPNWLTSCATPPNSRSSAARIPRGVLMVGSPGTGKTLLARAIAGEAKVPFFSISGSDFVEMFVGVGAARVRDMFEQAKKSMRRASSSSTKSTRSVAIAAQALGGGHDEREQTLNQLLVEMDGFESNDGVIIIAATNRPDVLDPALLRPGPFRPPGRGAAAGYPRPRTDSHCSHAQGADCTATSMPNVIARGTPGMSGADLANIVNEAALFAARSGRTGALVDMEAFRESQGQDL